MDLNPISKVANAEDISARVMLDSFDRWLSARVTEARAEGKDLAFRDDELGVDPSRDPPLVGWIHVLLEAGAAPPAGPDWTVYRFKPRGWSAKAPGTAALDQEALRLALEALGYGAYLTGNTDETAS